MTSVVAGARLPQPFPAESATEWGEDRYGLWVGFNLNDVTLRFRWIEPGSFMMGSPETEEHRLKNENRHHVTLSRGYWLAETECTQALWSAVNGEAVENVDEDSIPQTSVSWLEVSSWIKRLNRNFKGLDVRLPTEAEWEYACRAGSETAYWFGESVDATKAHVDGTAESAQAVKSLAPNPWGLYEMHGNVWEWCADWYDNYPDQDVINPSGPEDGELRVLRGGGWIDFAGNARSASRLAYDPGDAIDDVGFRLSRGQ